MRDAEAVAAEFLARERSWRPWCQPWFREWLKAQPFLLLGASMPPVFLARSLFDAAFPAAGLVGARVALAWKLRRDSRRARALALAQRRYDAWLSRGGL